MILRGWWCTLNMNEIVIISILKNATKNQCLVQNFLEWIIQFQFIIICNVYNVIPSIMLALYWEYFQFNENTFNVMLIFHTPYKGNSVEHPNVITKLVVCFNVILILLCWYDYDMHRKWYDILFTQEISMQRPTQNIFVYHSNILM